LVERNSLEVAAETDLAEGGKVDGGEVYWLQGGLGEDQVDEGERKREE